MADFYPTVLGNIVASNLSTDNKLLVQGTDTETKKRRVHGVSLSTFTSQVEAKITNNLATRDFYYESKENYNADGTRDGNNFILKPKNFIIPTADGKYNLDGLKVRFCASESNQSGRIQTRMLFGNKYFVNTEGDWDPSDNEYFYDNSEGLYYRVISTKSETEFHNFTYIYDSEQGITLIDNNFNPVTYYYSSDDEITIKNTTYTWSYDDTDNSLTLTPEGGSPIQGTDGAINLEVSYIKNFIAEYIPDINSVNPSLTDLPPTHDPTQSSELPPSGTLAITGSFIIPEGINNIRVWLLDNNSLGSYVDINNISGEVNIDNLKYEGNNISSLVFGIETLELTEDATPYIQLKLSNTSNESWTRSNYGPHPGYMPVYKGLGDNLLIGFIDIKKSIGDDSIRYTYSYRDNPKSNEYELTLIYTDEDGTREIHNNSDKTITIDGTNYNYEFNIHTLNLTLNNNGTIISGKHDPSSLGKLSDNDFGTVVKLTLKWNGSFATSYFILDNSTSNSRIGEIIMVADNKDRWGTVPCDGSLLDPKDYPDLFELLGYRYGSDYVAASTKNLNGLVSFYFDKGTYTTISGETTIKVSSEGYINFKTTTVGYIYHGGYYGYCENSASHYSYAKANVTITKTNGNIGTIGDKTYTESDGSILISKSYNVNPNDTFKITIRGTLTPAATNIWKNHTHGIISLGATGIFNTTEQPATKFRVPNLNGNANIPKGYGNGESNLGISNLGKYNSSGNGTTVPVRWLIYYK